MIILASQSPRRHELMKLTGLPFTIRIADVDETIAFGAETSSVTSTFSRSAFASHVNSPTPERFAGVQAYPPVALTWLSQQSGTLEAA